MQLVLGTKNKTSSYVCEFMQQSRQKEILKLISRGVELIDSPYGCELVIDNIRKIERDLDCNCQICLVLQDLQNAIDAKESIGIFYRLPKIIKGGF